MGLGLGDGRYEPRPVWTSRTLTSSFHWLLFIDLSRRPLGLSYPHMSRRGHGSRRLSRTRGTVNEEEEFQELLLWSCLLPVSLELVAEKNLASS